MMRFWSKVKKTQDCWIWTASRTDRGYGSFGLDGKVRRAHRVAYELAVGPIPDGMSILHACDNPPCVNPAHLRVGTQVQNMADELVRGRNHNAAKDRCVHGHAFTEGNTYVTPNGRRNCRTCRAAARRSFRARKAA